MFGELAPYSQNAMIEGKGLEGNFFSNLGFLTQKKFSVTQFKLFNNHRIFYAWFYAIFTLYIMLKTIEFFRDENPEKILDPTLRDAGKNVT